VTLLALIVVGLHLSFVAFATLGGLFVLRWPRVAFLHIPVAAWAVYVELSGTICPLTPLENSLRASAGLDAYSGDFVARYVFPVLYPDGLTRQAQVALGTLLAAMNVVVYGWMLWRRRRPRAADAG
jgi:hypothetical protein